MMAFRPPIKSERVNFYRKKELRLWHILKNVCQQVIEGKKHPGAKNKIWKSSNDLYKACKYVLNHFDALTVYTTNPELFSENNCMERNLRMEKIIEDSSKFRSSLEGRAALDILRTIIATCSAAEIPFEVYLKDIMQTPKKIIEAEADKYIPFQYRNLQKSA